MNTEQYSGIEQMVLFENPGGDAMVGYSYCNPNGPDGFVRPYLVMLTPPKELYGKPNCARR